MHRSAYCGPVMPVVGPNDMMKRIVATVGAALAAGVFLPTGIITHTYVVRPHQVEGWGDWLQVLLPLAPPIVALYVSFLLGRKSEGGPVGRGLIWGAFTACTAYMTLQTLELASQFTLISQDGEAHWAMLQLPAFWIALPALLIGLGIGALGGWIRKKMRPIGIGTPLALPPKLIVRTSRQQLASSDYPGIGTVSTSSVLLQAVSKAPGRPVQQQFSRGVIFFS